MGSNYNNSNVSTSTVRIAEDMRIAPLPTIFGLVGPYTYTVEDAHACAAAVAHVVRLAPGHCVCVANAALNAFAAA